MHMDRGIKNFTHRVKVGEGKKHIKKERINDKG